MIGEITQLHPDLHRRLTAERAWGYLTPSPDVVVALPILRRRELFAAGLCVVLFLAAQIAVAGPRVLYDRSCWIDEYITQLLVSDPSVRHSVDAVRHGVDTNPPIYHLVSRMLVRAADAISPTSIRITLRLFSTCCVVGALLAAYVLLRQAFSPGPVIVALLTVLPHPQLIEQMFEARAYAPLLGASLAVTLSLQLRGNGKMRSIYRALAIAISAGLLCTLHYFGILILGTLMIASAVVDSGPMSRRLWRVAPALAGLIALLAFLPFTRTQAAGLTQGTFLVPLSPRSARDFLIEVFYPLPLFVLLAGWVIGHLIRQTQVVPTHSRIARMRAMIPMMSLAAIPLFILIFSMLVQSALRPRYALVATFAIAPAAAMLASTLRPRMLIAIALPLLIMTFMQIVGTARMHDQVQRITAGEASLARRDAPNIPIIFADRGDAIELADLAPDLVSRIVIVDERRTPAVQLSDHRRYDLEMMKKASAFYPTPPLVTPRDLLNFDRVRIVANSDDLSRILLEVPMRHVHDSLFQPIE